MMRRSATVTHQRIAVGPANETIEQTISVDMAAFFSAKKETDSAKSMNSGSHSRHFVHGLFYCTDGAQTRRRKERGRAE
ncbi:MAG: hypothetical protein QOK24_1374 [Verrucomicrobiota bacterium]